jgi:hypothetical protein
MLCYVIVDNDVAVDDDDVGVILVRFCCVQVSVVWRRKRMLAIALPSVCCVLCNEQGLQIADCSVLFRSCQNIYMDSWESRRGGGEFPAGPDVYRDFCYERDDAQQSFRSWTVQSKAKTADACVPLLK